jgi:hypothetical protein
MATLSAISPQPYNRRPVPPNVADLPNWLPIEFGDVQRAVAALTTSMANAPRFNVLDYTGGITIHTNVNDAVSAITKADADAAAAGGGVVDFPAGTFRTSAVVSPSNGVEWKGVGGRGNSAYLTGQAITRIEGAHTGIAVVSFQNRAACKLTNIGVYGNQGVVPKAGLLLGRAASLASAGCHTLYDVQVSGYFTICPWYMVASEEIRTFSCSSILNGGGAKCLYYIGQSDGLAVAPPAPSPLVLGGSTNIDVIHYGFQAISYLDDPTVALIFLDGGANTKSHSFFGGYFSLVDGTYVRLRLYETDNQPTAGPITFMGVSGERTSGVVVTAGAFVVGQTYQITTVGTTNFVAIGAASNTVNVTFVATGAGTGTGTATTYKGQKGISVESSAASSVSGLTVQGCVFPTAVGTGRFFVQGALATIKDSLIFCQGQNANNTANGANTLVPANLSNVLVGDGTGLTYYGPFGAPGAVTLAGGLVSYGAADSAGAGFRTVRVPN